MLTIYNLLFEGILAATLIQSKLSPYWVGSHILLLLCYIPPTKSNLTEVGIAMGIQLATSIALVVLCHFKHKGNPEAGAESQVGGSAQSQDRSKRTHAI